MSALRSPLAPAVVLAMLVVSACATATRGARPAPDIVSREGPEWSAPGPDVAPPGTVTPEQGVILPYLVRRGWVDLTVEKPAETAARAQEITTRLGGMTAHARIGEKRAELVLRVPELRLDEAMDSLSTLGELESRRLGSDDVTQEVIDLEARLASLVGIRDRLRALLDRSSSMGEIMSIERELARVQTEIDSIEGRLRHLRSRSTMAELSLSASRERILGPIGYVIAGLGWTLGKLFVIQ